MIVEASGLSGEEKDGKGRREDRWKGEKDRSGI